MILFLKHIDIEGPGTIAPFFEKLGFQEKTIELAAGDPLPDSLDGIEAVVILGGPMNVYEEEKYAFLKSENEFIKKILKEEIPTLGICLGSQLIAKATDAKVSKADAKEIGWSHVDLSEKGKEDPLFQNIDQHLEVFQWHEDTFQIPDGGELLASSSVAPHQAYRLGKNVYGLQFHIEVTDEIISNWIERYFKVENASEHPEGSAMLGKYSQAKNMFDINAGILYSNFAEIIKERSEIKC